MIAGSALQNAPQAETVLTGKDSPLSFEEIYREYGGRILNLAHRMTGQEDIARDLTQDIFIKVYQRLDSFRGESQVYTWIYRVAVNHILNFLKQQRRRKWLSLLDQPLGDALKEEEVSPHFWGSIRPENPEQKLEKRQREEIVWSAIEALPPKYRVPLVLFRYEGLSYLEIAETLELSLSAVETRIHRARKALMTKLEPWVDAL